MRRADRGIAQILVLWALLLVGTLAASFAFSMRTEAIAARNGLDGTRAYYQARTGVNHALAVIGSVPPDNVLGAEIAGEDDDAAYEVLVENEKGKVDVNFVSEGMLKQLLRGGGLDEDEAEAVGDAILEWRDETGKQRTHGPGDGYYSSLPEPVRPRHGKFGSVEELRSVKGVSPGFYARFLAKVFTVYSRSPQVNINCAPVEVLRALPGFTPEMADEVVARRNDTPFRTPADLTPLFGGKGAPPELFSFVVLSGYSPVYTVVSRGTAGGSIVRVIRCTAEAAGGQKGTVRVLRWADHVPADEAPADETPGANAPAGSGAG